MDAEVRKHLGRFYGAIDLKSSEQAFRREVTTELINALSSGCTEAPLVVR